MMSSSLKLLGLLKVGSVFKFSLRCVGSSPLLNVSFNIQDVEDFEERVMKKSTPVVVDFHATWCGPCKLLAPRLETAIAARKGAVELAKVDIDEHSEIALEHGVQAVPHVLGIRDGKVINQFTGLQDSDKIDAFLAKLLKE